MWRYVLILRLEDKETLWSFIVLNCADSIWHQYQSICLCASLRMKYDNYSCGFITVLWKDLLKCMLNQRSALSILEMYASWIEMKWSLYSRSVVVWVLNWSIDMWISFQVCYRRRNNCTSTLWCLSTKGCICIGMNLTFR